MTLELADSTGVNYARFIINDEVVAVRDTEPFKAEVRVPADLKNGQPFDVEVELETVWGDVKVHRSSGYSCSGHEGV